MISIIVPCYNQAQYMDECLQSVFEQTYQNWECIIVNDGSSDNTKEVALRWCEKDPRFKYLLKENGGSSSARNAGIEIANGEWILPLDSDDKIGDRYLELCYNETKKGYNLVYSKLQYFGIKNEILDFPNDSYKSILYFNPLHCTSLFEKSKWKQVGGYDENPQNGFEDWEFWINIIYNTEIKISKIEDYVGFYYRQKEVSRFTTVVESKEKFNNSIKYIIEKHLEHYVANFLSIQDQLHSLRMLKKKEESINLLKKSRIIKFLNMMGFLKWIQRI